MDRLYEEPHTYRLSATQPKPDNTEQSSSFSLVCHWNKRWVNIYWWRKIKQIETIQRNTNTADDDDDNEDDFFILFFSVRLLSVLRGHSGFFIPTTTANDLRLRRISIPDLIYYIIFLS